MSQWPVPVSPGIVSTARHYLAHGVGFHHAVGGGGGTCNSHPACSWSDFSPVDCTVNVPHASHVTPWGVLYSCLIVESTQDLDMPDGMCTCKPVLLIADHIGLEMSRTSI